MSFFARLANRLGYLYKLHIFRDPFLREVRRWFRDRGDQTLRLDYPLTSDSLVIDVGAYRGDFANAIYEQFGCRVLLFEPVAEFYAYCVERFRAIPRIEVYGYGLGTNDALLPIEVKGDGSSFISFVQPHTPQRQACIKRADRVFEELALKQIDLMKINIEGGEYDLLELLISSGWIRRIRFLQIQFHNFFPEAPERRQAIRAKLGASHEEMWNYEFVWESWVLRS
ncbi:FkbM family methyltransferase [Thermosynechococcus vestitus]|uniref:FkbM family methyltransferase n=1 Tax=Thermosynechococcus vestitus TaxID=146786 RepID=UPI000323C601|nr:FkbM family methyltransferase [Thermosynechococcus vestitus]